MGGGGEGVRQEATENRQKYCFKSIFSKALIKLQLFFFGILGVGRREERSFSYFRFSSPKYCSGANQFNFLNGTRRGEKVVNGYDKCLLWILFTFYMPSAGGLRLTILPENRVCQNELVLRFFLPPPLREGFQAGFLRAEVCSVFSSANENGGKKKPLFQN